MHGNMPNYDTSSLIRDPSGLVKTGEYTSVDPESLSPAGYQMATTYAQKASPLATISTESATETLNRKVGKLNGYSPTTAPGYTPPVQEKKADRGVTGDVNKAYFTNEAGQEAEYTQEQLNAPETRDFLSKGGYVMTKTEGPTGLSGEVSDLDKKITGLADKILSYTPESDPSFSPIISSIHSQYNQLRGELQKGFERSGRSLTTSGMRTGLNRYAPGSAEALQIGLLEDYTDKLGEYASKEASAISEARNTYASGQYTKFNNAMNTLEKIRDDKASTLKDINKTIQDAITETRKAERQASRDEAISGLIAQGITDPKQILNYLNSYDDGTPTGGNFTAKEINDALKNLAPGGDIEKLTGETKNFYIRKSMGDLPEDIKALPEDQQLFSYLAREAAATRVGEKDRNDVFTLQEVLAARKGGMDIPLSLAGMSQVDFEESLSSDTPPEWFREKLAGQLEIDPKVANIIELNSPAVKRAWEEYRATIELDSEGGGA